VSPSSPAPGEAGDVDFPRGIEPAAASENDVLATAAAGPRALRGGGLRLLAFGAGTLVSVFSAALLLRHLGRADTGRYATVLSLVAIVASLSDLGLTAVGVREISSRPQAERSDLARDLLGLRITLTLLGGLITTGIAAVAYSPRLAAGVALASIGLLLQTIQDNYSLSLVVGLRFGWIALLDFMRLLFTAIATALLVLVGATLLPFLGMSIPVGLLLIAGTVLLIRGSRSLAPSFDVARWRGFLAGMVPYSLAIAASALYFRVAILLVAAISSPGQAGDFGACFRIVEVLAMVPILLIGSALPIFSRAASNDHERLGYALGRVFEVTTIVGAWVAVSVAVAAPLVIEIVGGRQFKGAAPVLALQGIGVGAMFVSQVWANGLLSLGLYRRILAISLSALAMNAALVAALTAVDGSRGAAIATSIAEIVLAVVQMLAVVRSRPGLRPSLRVLPRTALAAGLGLAPLALAYLGVPTIVRLFVSSVLFIGVIAATRAYPPELLDLLPSRRLNLDNERTA